MRKGTDSCMAWRTWAGLAGDGLLAATIVLALALGWSGSWVIPSLGGVTFACFAVVLVQQNMPAPWGTAPSGGARVSAPDGPELRVIQGGVDGQAGRGFAMSLARLVCLLRGHDWQERGCGSVSVWGTQEDTEVYCRRCDEPISERGERRLQRRVRRASARFEAKMVDQGGGDQ